MQCSPDGGGVSDKNCVQGGEVEKVELRSPPI